MKKVFFGLVASAALFITSCTTYAPVAATSNTVGKKCGTASYNTYLMALAFGDSNYGINKAAKQGGITKISHVDSKCFNLLGLFQKHTILVYGE